MRTSCDRHIVWDKGEKRICEKTLRLNNRLLLILACRFAAVVILGHLWVFRQQADAFLERGWQILRVHWLFQHESFEVSVKYVQRQLKTAREADRTFESAGRTNAVWIVRRHVYLCSIRYKGALNEKRRKHTPHPIPLYVGSASWIQQGSSQDNNGGSGGGPVCTS